MEVEVWTDGACDAGGRGGWAFILTVPGNPFAYHEQSGSVEGATSQRMELTALVEALRWISNGWVNSRREPVANRDLWEQLLQLLEMNNVAFRFVKVKGHRGVELNERCDALAVEARIALKNK
jgi:ribonuclease HI